MNIRAGLESIHTGHSRCTEFYVYVGDRHVACTDVELETLGSF